MATTKLISVGRAYSYKDEGAGHDGPVYTAPARARTDLPGARMCFSADASLAAGVALLPAGAYTLTAALRKNRAYLPVAATPLVFGVQQLCEAGVWHGLEHGDPRLVEYATLGFLFFATVFWPAWVPFGAAVLEDRPGRRRALVVLAAAGLGVGCLGYAPAVLHYGEWLRVETAGHSIRYDFSRVPETHTAAGYIGEVIYLIAVCVPLLIMRDPRLRILGGSITVSAVVTHAVFWYAFISVWCFFAAILSLQICYILYRLPGPAGEGRTRAGPA